MSFKEELDVRCEIINSLLENYGKFAEKSYQKTVMEAMEYSLFAGGKRLRPMLMLETYRMFGGKGEVIEPFMAAIEMLHTYSLVHDDLPAMDNDEYRRGRKTTHIVYGEDMAILCGDALLNYSFEIALKAYDVAEPEEVPRIAGALKVFANKAGIFGMVGGQTFDVEAERLEKKVNEEELLFIFRLKTAALLQSSMMVGAILAGASEEDVEKISEIAMNVGIAFQIQDDILDVTSTQEVLGKPIGSDERNNKTTYVTLKGLDVAKEDVRRYSNAALKDLSELSVKNEFLYKLIEELITRVK